MNKKYLMIGLPILALGLVMAGVLVYYGMFSQTFTVVSAISVSDCSEVIAEDVYSGDPIIGSPCTITNNAPTERIITISNNANTSEIEVSYRGVLTLDKKDSNWKPKGEEITINYTIVGKIFEVTGVEEGYTVIYYKDAFVELGERIANPQPAISIVGIESLPQVGDANMDELANYCATPDFYNQCKGAKLWVVPSEDVNAGDLNWVNMDNYYYELDLIQYNTDGNIVMSGSSILVITPVYTTNPLLSSGSYTINTTIA